MRCGLTSQLLRAARRREASVFPAASLQSRWNDHSLAAHDAGSADSSSELPFFPIASFPRERSSSSEGRVPESTAARAQPSKLGPHGAWSSPLEHCSRALTGVPAHSIPRQLEHTYFSVRPLLGPDALPGRTFLAASAFGRQKLASHEHSFLPRASRQPHRSMFIQTQSTPNPASLMFLPGSPVVPGEFKEYNSARAAMQSPLAIAIFRLDGISRVFLGSDFITVTKQDDASWDVLKPEIFAAIMDFYASGKPVVDPAAAAAATAESGEQDSEVVEMIKELLETRIRPAVQEDGGDIDFHNFDEETGVVTLRMRGACSGCPSSSVTLKSGVENMLMHYIPEVTSVEQLMEEEEDSDEAATSPATT